MHINSIQSSPAVKISKISGWKTNVVTIVDRRFELSETQMNKRIGFACKWIDNASQVDGIKPTDSARQYNTGTTTVAWLNRQAQSVAEQRLWDLMVNNIEATRKLVERVGTLDENLRMVRLSSDILPCYTHGDWKFFWHRSDVREYCEQNFAKIGDVARRSNVRLSFHPGQFCVLASANDNIIENSIEEFEYHATMARWIGYGKQFQDFKINIHLSGKKGVDGFSKTWNKLSSEARNCLTLENDEYQAGIDTLIALKDKVAIVLDVHHHFIHSYGEYIQANDDRIKHIIESWRGVRPVIHYSQSREDYLVDHSTTEMPDYSQMLERGYKRQQLRAHSDFMWNDAMNQWALTHLEWADIMVEAKAKNLASFSLYDQNV